jgi:hypothetical protein
MIFPLAFHMGSVESNTCKTGENQMNRITMLLKTSDVMAVRRAVFAAGADRVVVSPLPRQAWAAYLQDWYFGKPVLWCDAPVRIDVGVDEYHADEIVSAFLATAHVGKIERIAQYPSKTKDTSRPLLQAA